MVAGASQVRRQIALENEADDEPDCSHLVPLTLYPSFEPVYVAPEMVIGIFPAEHDATAIAISGIGVIAVAERVSDVREAMK